MDTGTFAHLRLYPMPRALIWLLRTIPYFVAGITLLMALAITVDIQTLRGTLQWAKSQGFPIEAFGVFSAVVSGIGAVGWRSLRRKPLTSILLYFLVSAPYLVYCAIGTYYILTSLQASYISAVVYWGGWLFGFLLIALVSLISAWTEVTLSRARG